MKEWNGKSLVQKLKDNFANFQPASNCYNVGRICKRIMCFLSLLPLLNTNNTKLVENLWSCLLNLNKYSKLSKKCIVSEIQRLAYLVNTHCQWGSTLSKDTNKI